MAWSMVKEIALRDLRPVGGQYAEFLHALSGVEDEHVPEVVKRLKAERSSVDVGGAP